MTTATAHMVKRPAAPVGRSSAPVMRSPVKPVRAGFGNAVIARAALARAPSPLAAPVVARRGLNSTITRSALAVPQATMSVQTSLTVSAPEDACEIEAEHTANSVMRSTVPENAETTPKSADSSNLHRGTESPLIQRQGKGTPRVTPEIAAGIQSGAAGGSPLPNSVRRFMEPRFKADFGNVRVHTGHHAADLNRQLGARAFTVGSNVFFGHNKFQPEGPEGRHLIAHELTHTIQQGAVQQDRGLLRRSVDPAISMNTPVQVQRLGLDTVLNYFADKANLIPGFRMFTIILGINPINWSPVERTAANILRAVVEFIPGGGVIVQALDHYGIFEKVGIWIEQQIAALGLTGSSIKKALSQFLDSLGITDIASPGSVWDRAKTIFSQPINRIIQTAKGFVVGVVEFIKDAILRPVAKLAEGTNGYDLLKGVLGKDPITGDPVARSAETLLGPFMKMIGQGEVWESIQKAHAIPRCWAWFQKNIGVLLGYVADIPRLFVTAFKSLELMDIVVLPRAFGKIAGVFSGFLVSFGKWGLSAVWDLLEIVFDVVSPGALVYIKKTGAALKSILKNPLPFVGNLVKAAKLGFVNFGTNFVTHLKAGLIDWLTGSLPGVYIPKAFTLPEVGKFALSVLGISWGQIRGKIVKALGPSGETIMKGLETTFDVVVALVTGGPAAAWDLIKEKLSGLKDMVIGGITDFIVDIVVKKAIPKLIAMFIPGAGFISAILSIYDTIMVFVSKIAKIIQVVTAFIDSIVAIAGGAIGAAANRVESILAGLLSLAINFLAGFVGLGKVADKIIAVLEKVRAMVDKALDTAITWIVGKAKKLTGVIAGGAKGIAGKVLDWWRTRKPFSAADGAHELYFQGAGSSAILMVASTPAPVNAFLSGLSSTAGNHADPKVRTAYSDAKQLSKEIDSVRTKIESGPTPRQPADIDTLNKKMERLAKDFLPILIPVAFPAPISPSGGTPVPVGNLIKLTESNLVAVVTQYTPIAGGTLANFRVVSPRSERATANLASGFLASTFGKAFTPYTADPRLLYLGPTPGKTSSVGAVVKARMIREGKIINNRVLYGERRELYDISNCDMGHVIDAVTWWNSNGRLTGARSAVVMAFMNDPDNYEFEPSAINQARGAALGGSGVRYLPPAI